MNLLHFPESSPKRGQSPEPYACGKSLLVANTTHPDQLQKKLIGAPSSSALERASRGIVRASQLSRPDKRGGGLFIRSTSKILERVESLGLDNIISLEQAGFSPLALHQQSMMYPSSIARNLSPMAQLTSLKSLQEGGSGGAVTRSQMVIKKEAIKAVLNKAMLSSELQRKVTLAAKTTSKINYDGDQSDTQSEEDAQSSIYSDNNDNKDPRRTILLINDKHQNVKKSTSNDNNNSGSSSSSSDIKINDKNSSTGSRSSTGVSDVRLKQMQRQRSRRTIMASSGSGQRPDLGTVVVSKEKIQKAAATSAPVKQSSDQVEPRPSAAQTFVGSISSLLFGRKGGLL